MSTTQAVIEWDAKTGEVVKFNGAEMGDNVVPIIENFGLSFVGDCRLFGVTPSQRVLPERPEGVPETAVPATVWVEAPADGYCKTYYASGWFDLRCPEHVASHYGVTFPEPEPTLESVIGIDKVEALDAAGFEIVRKPADKTKPNCVNCGRPLKVNDDGSLYLDYHGDVLHHDMNWECLNGTSIVSVATPEGVR